MTATVPGGDRRTGSAAMRTTTVSTMRARSATSQIRRAVSMSRDAIGIARSDATGVFGPIDLADPAVGELERPSEEPRVVVDVRAPVAVDHEPARLCSRSGSRSASCRVPARPYRRRRSSRRGWPARRRTRTRGCSSMDAGPSHLRGTWVPRFYVGPVVRSADVRELSRSDRRDRGRPAAARRGGAPTARTRHGGSRFTTTAAGIPFSALTWGDPADRPLVLIHGVTASARIWWRVGPALAATGRRVVAVDQAGPRPDRALAGPSPVPRQRRGRRGVDPCGRPGRARRSRSSATAGAG